MIKASRMRALRGATLAFAALAAIAALGALSDSAAAQSAPTGSIEFSASVTPTDGRPQPARQFTFYLLRRSIADVYAEAQAADPPPQINAFIDSLAISPELKDWMKKTKVIDLAGPDFTHALTPEFLLSVPEFTKAYVQFNTGYPGSGFPMPKYKPGDQQKNPDKYAQEVKDYRAALLHYATENPLSKDGMEVEITDINPIRKWNALVSGELDRVQKRTLRMEQTQYLAAQADTDLDGQGSFGGVPAGDYWLGTLGAVAQGGDIRQSWDVPVTVRASQTTRIALTNVNAVASVFPPR
ncbi:MAG: hypothetical protein WA871_13980 [Candidatus Acidiferrales bacterium]